jgi:hypothetical protein
MTFHLEKIEGDRAVAACGSKAKGLQLTESGLRVTCNACLRTIEGEKAPEPLDVLATAMEVVCAAAPESRRPVIREVLQSLIFAPEPSQKMPYDRKLGRAR